MAARRTLSDLGPSVEDRKQADAITQRAWLAWETVRSAVDDCIDGMHFHEADGEPVDAERASEILDVLAQEALHRAILGEFRYITAGSVQSLLQADTGVNDISVTQY